jgi:hypothetical protein
MNIRMILAAAALLLSACAQPAMTPSAATPETLAPQAAVKVDWQAADTQEKCATISGNWRPICMRGMPACVVAFKDAGKSCSDSSECSGRCITSGENIKPEMPTKGVCTANSDPCGCFQLVENGKAGYAMCAD